MTAKGLVPPSAGTVAIAADFYTRQCHTKIEMCSRLPLQHRSLPGRALDPLTGRRVLVNPARTRRLHRSSNCPYRRGHTPSTLFYVDDFGALVVEQAQETLRLPSLAKLESTAQLARALVGAVRSYERLLRGVSPYNVVVRTGQGLGHLHAEVVPRGGVNVPAGFELATGLGVITTDPSAVGATLREQEPTGQPAP